MNTQLAAYLIEIGTALTMVLFGIDQMRKPQEWTHYIPDALKKSSPMKPETSMRLHSLGNIIFGLFLVSQLWPLVGAWIAFIWWLSIVPFAFRGAWQIAMRDLTIVFALGALIVLLS